MPNPTQQDPAPTQDVQERLEAMVEAGSRRIPSSKELGHRSKAAREALTASILSGAGVPDLLSELEHVHERARVMAVHRVPTLKAERDEARADLQTKDRENDRLRGALEMVSAHYSASLDHQPSYVRVVRDALAGKHDAYANPVNGGWDGYQGACHDCDWRADTVHPPGSDGKQKARADAREHEASTGSTERAS